jgi:Zn finger protein HypA/HybF involved in hydrogenase expression
MTCNCLKCRGEGPEEERLPSEIECSDCHISYPKREMFYFDGARRWFCPDCWQNHIETVGDEDDPVDSHLAGR